MLNYEKLFLNQRISIRDAMNKLSETSEKILLIIDKDKRLLGTVTDGDIRRWILKEGSLDEPLEKVMNKNPIVVSVKEGLDNVKELMYTHRVECIPQVDGNNRIVAAYNFEDILSESDIHAVRGNINIPVVIMAGGKGGRLKPFTDILPKPLIPVGDKPIIERIMNIFHSFGVRDFFVTINYKAVMVKAYFSEHSLPYSIHFIEEEKPSGTAGSLVFLKDRISTAFFVTNCDIIVRADYADVLSFHKRENNTLTVVCSMKNFKIPYGVVYHENNGKFKYMKEKPEMDFLVNTGIYILEPEALNMIPHGIEYDMNRFIEELQKRKKSVGIYPVSDKSWLDMGQWEEYRSSLRILEGS